MSANETSSVRREGFERLAVLEEQMNQIVLKDMVEKVNSIHRVILGDNGLSVRVGKMETSLARFTVRNFLYVVGTTSAIVLSIREILRLAGLG